MLDSDDFVWLRALTLLGRRWSPHQSSSTCKRIVPNDRKRHVPDETIYTAVFERTLGGLRCQLVAWLRQDCGALMPRTSVVGALGQIPDMLRIHLQPPEIEDRAKPAYREGDFIEGVDNQSSAGVLVGRSRRMVPLANIEVFSSCICAGKLFCEAQFYCHAQVALPDLQTTTYSQCKEMSRHAGTDPTRLINLVLRLGLEIAFQETIYIQEEI